jgi:hypothetical protein
MILHWVERVEATLSTDILMLPAAEQMGVYLSSMINYASGLCRVENDPTVNSLMLDISDEKISFRLVSCDPNGTWSHDSAQAFFEVGSGAVASESNRYVSIMRARMVPDTVLSPRQVEYSDFDRADAHAALISQLERVILRKAKSAGVCFSEEGNLSDFVSVLTKIWLENALARPSPSNVGSAHAARPAP